MTRLLRQYVLPAALLAAALACEDGNDPGLADGGLGQGATCSSSSECGSNLVCSGYGTCQPPGQPGTGDRGKPCVTYVHCQKSYTCDTGKRVCALFGSGSSGSQCKGNHECSQGLICTAGGKCAALGSSGAVGSGGKCASGDADCAPGLVCVGGTCQAPSYWSGTTCGAGDSGPFRALFELPRKNKPTTEFYRLPFPNDIRKKGGRVDVTGHPDPGSLLPAPYNSVVKNLLAAINKDVTGFGLNTAVLLRMSHAFNVQSLTLSGSTPTVQFLNIDKQSPGYGKGVGMTMFASTARGRYICHNVVAVRPNIGSPLLPKSTYAVLLRRGIKTKAGKEAAADTDFALMLKAGEPMSEPEKSAWQAYKPLRIYLADNKISHQTIIGAAVFTTMDPRARAARLRAQVHAKMPEPTLSQLTLCDGIKKSPCTMGGASASYACPTSTSKLYHELQGIIEVPVLQKGKRPYKTVDDMGYIEYDSDGKPVIQAKEKLCVSITVPRKEMPKGGWPVVLYGHGSGGDYRSFITNKTVDLLSAVSDSSSGGSGEAAFAMVSIDGALHGARRASSDTPRDLFFNLLNLRASRDNVLQGAADKFQLTRLVKGLSLDDKGSPTGEALSFDAKQIYFFGHSQGTVEGLPYLAHEPDVRGAVLSGAGGYLLGSLLEKSRPRNISGMVKLALADPYLGTTHPLLNLMQLLFEEVDGINYGSGLFHKPASGVDPKHIFLSKGVADGYTPPGTVDALVRAAGLRKVKQDAQRCGDGRCTGIETCKSCETDCKKCSTSAYCGDNKCASGETCRDCPGDCPDCPLEFPTDTPPVRGNIYKSSTVKYTVGMVEYASDGTYDDHQVIFRNPAARTQSSQFLGSAVWDKEGWPTIPAKK